LGGLFYYSRQKDAPVGRIIRGLRVKPVQYFRSLQAFELRPLELVTGTPPTTILATETPKERDVWIAHLVRLGGDTFDGDDLMPMDMFRERSATRSADARNSSSRHGTPMRRRSVTAEMLRDPVLERRPSIDPTKTCEVPEDPWMSLDVMSSASASRPLLSVPSSATKVRSSSQGFWAERDHSVLILDWDDTIFPTTWVREDCSLIWKLPLDSQLDASDSRAQLIKGLLANHLKKAEEFIETAMSVANVFIVTLARRPWVSTSITNFMPGFRRVMEKHQVKCIYAQEYFTDELRAEYDKDEFRSSEQLGEFWTRVKTSAISHELEHQQVQLEEYNVFW